MTICREDDCQAAAFTRGLCGPHYKRARRRGEIDTLRPEWHRVIEVSDDGKRGVCSVCGPTAIYSYNGGTRRRCPGARVTHGLTRTALRDMVEKQGGGCAICGNVGQLVVDHDHNCCPGDQSCGKCIRGLLCSKCNTGIGMLGDSTDTVASALHYLRTSHGSYGRR